MSADNLCEQFGPRSGLTSHHLDPHCLTLWWYSWTGADPGFLERGFICIKVRGVGSLCWFYPFFLNILWKWKKFGLTQRPNYFIFTGYLKTVGEERGFEPTPSGSATAWKNFLKKWILNKDSRQQKIMINHPAGKELKHNVNESKYVW